jgi:two-component system, probable response regulator PhcQ
MINTRSPIDYKRYSILYVDDEPLTVKYFRKAFESAFTILSANDATEAIALLKSNDHSIAVVVTDQRMPGQTGVELLERACHIRPKTVRILVTAHTDYNTSIAAINSGSVWRHVTKPWDVIELELDLKRAVEHYTLQMEHEILLKQKLTVFYQYIITDRVLGLGLLGASLSRNLANPLRAVTAYLNIAVTQASPRPKSLNSLRQPEFWLSLQTQAKHRVNLLLAILEPQLATTTTPQNQATSFCVTEVIRKAAHAANMEHSKPVCFVSQTTFSSNVIGNAPKVVEALKLLIKHRLYFCPEGVALSAHTSPKSITTDGLSHAFVSIADAPGGRSSTHCMPMLDPLLPTEEAATEADVSLLAACLLAYDAGATLEIDSRGRELNLQFGVFEEPKGIEEQIRQFLLHSMTGSAIWKTLSEGIRD